MRNRGSTTGHDADDLQPITVVQRAPGKFRGRDGFAVVLHHDATREESLRAEKLIERTGELNGDALAVGDDDSSGHQVKVSRLTSGGQLMRIP